MKYDELEDKVKKLISYIDSLDPSSWNFSSYNNGEVTFKQKNNSILFYLDNGKNCKCLAFNFDFENFRVGGHFPEDYFDEAKVFMDKIWDRFYMHYYHSLRLKILF